MEHLVRAVLVALLFSAGFAGISDAVQRPQTRGEILGRQGWEAIREGKIPEAAGLFEEAISLRPEDPGLRLGAGLAAHLQGQDARARRTLEDSLRLDPKLTPASLLLGELSYRAGDLPGAIQIYEAALPYAKDSSHLKAKLEKWRKEAALHGSFQQNLNSHFTVLFEGPAEQRLAGAALDYLEAAYWRIGTALLAYPPDIITVVLYTDEQFRDITRSPTWAGGVYDGKIRVPMRGALDDPAKLEKVLAHEFTHALVKSLAPRGAPTWLDEGLAVVFEAGRMDWAEQLTRKSSALVPLTELHNGFLKLPAEQVPLAYAESAVAVQMLLDRAGPLAFAALLKDLSDGQPFADAFEHRFSLSYLDFQAAWQQRLRGG